MSAWCYVLAWAATLAAQLIHLPLAGPLAGLAILVFLLLEFPNQRRYAQVLFVALVGVGMIGIVAAAHPRGLFLAAWERGAGYAAFFLALTTLRDAAETSPLVRRCGRHLVAQPPGRRYAALTAGGHVFGIILSYGAIELLAAMVARANDADDTITPAARAVRGRRMLMAIYRGFCVMNCWSPLNIMTAVVSTAVPTAPMGHLLPIAFVVAVGMAALGWLEDRLSAARRALQPGTAVRTKDPWSIHFGIIILVAAVMLLAEGLYHGLGISLVTAVTAVVPVAAIVWIVVQVRRQPPRVALAILARRLHRYRLRVPGFRAEATVLAASGFMAFAIGGALPTHGIAPLLSGLPPLAVPLLVPVVLIATGQIGLNPVAVVALLGAVIPHPEALGIAPATLAFAFMLSWGLGVGMTPMSASAITTARWAGVAPWTVSTVWNAAFTASALVLAWCAIVLLNGMLG
jgi:hypothetical protein